ncbi:hypothetical protein BY996DRAFT_7797118 [Phakopsora pachyrhizi]|nr:hypothetical protein BY996DRAFT_7797118 [Phakopsora pachyrhizi]
MDSYHHQPSARASSTTGLPKQSLPSPSDQSSILAPSQLRLQTSMSSHQQLSQAEEIKALTPVSTPCLPFSAQPYTNTVFLNRRLSAAILASTLIDPTRKPWHGGPGRTTVSGGGGPQGRDVAALIPGNSQGLVDSIGEGSPSSLPPPSGVSAGASTDSITLGQLKQISKAGNSRELPAVYDFPSLHTHPPHIAAPSKVSYEGPSVDASDMFNELDEFYSYVEVPGVIEGRETWDYDPDAKSESKNQSPNQKSRSTRTWAQWVRDKGKRFSAWVDADPEVQKSYVIHLLDRLEDKDPEIRFDSARRILYITQGTFAHSTSRENHLELVRQNARILRDAGALEAIFGALKGVGGRHDWISSLPESSDPNTSHMGPYLEPSDRQAFLEEINGELAIHLAIIYFMVEVFRGEESWGEELMGLDPPLPIYAFGLVAGLREKSAKGYPVKKLLLLLWKSMLATLGGMVDVERVKKMVRSIESLPPDSETPSSSFKVSPLDFYTFRKEIIAKYPTYVPPDTSEAYLGRLAAAAAPTPIRPSAMYHPANSVIPHDPSGKIKSHPNNNLQPGTPAASPPPSPQQKLKKQQFQTDQTRPFVLPFSPANAKLTSAGTLSLVPRSIDEAGELYKSHMRISTELWQTWKVREEFMADESGLAKVEAASNDSDIKLLERGSILGITNKMSSLSIEQAPLVASGANEQVTLPDSLQMLIELEEKILSDLQTAERLRDHETSQKLKQDALDTVRLQRVELLYRSLLPQMQSAVIVLLKLLLATVTASTNANGATEAEQAKPLLTIEDIDILRHREITSKAVSAILILTLKWFKVSHVMKFHYLAQLLVDSNCLLLILKMFGLQEVAVQVKTTNDFEDFNFFRYCALYGSQFPSEQRQEDSLLQSSTNQAPSVKKIRKGDEEVELITDYSWRNFFSAINFVHILQKLTKSRVHRILLLVQYKSSAILKRILRVNHPTLQLYVLKVLKSQVPYCGRKWRQTNMKVITAIYLNCRANLRDEWLLGIDLDGDVEDSFPQEQALRSLASFYNCKHYSAFAPNFYRRPSSMIVNAPEVAPNNNGSWNQADRQGGAQANSMTPSTPESDVFPPIRTFYDNTRQIDPTTAIDGLLDDCEVESLFYPHYSVTSSGSLERNDDAASSAWHRLGELLGDFDDISDSESIASIGYLGGEFGLDGNISDGCDTSSQDDFKDDDHNNQRAEWEHLSPETITALEEERKTSEGLNPNGSPSQLPRRRKSSEPKSPALRPVVFDGRDDDEDAVNEVFKEGGAHGLGVMENSGSPSPVNCSPRRSPHFGPQFPLNSANHNGPAVDEVELIFGE